MNDVVAEVEESRRGAMVRFEGGERLWFGRGAWLERSPLRPGDVEDLDVLKQWLLPRQYPQALAGAVRLLAARARSTGEIRQKRMGRRARTASDRSRAHPARAGPQGC